MEPGHRNALACVEHVDAPQVVAASGGIEVDASRELHSGEPLQDNHGGSAVGAVPVRGSFRGGGGRRAVAGQQLLAEWEALGAESIRQETEVSDSDAALG